MNFENEEEGLLYSLFIILEVRTFKSALLACDIIENVIKKKWNKYKYDARAKIRISLFYNLLERVQVLDKKETTEVPQNYQCIINKLNRILIFIANIDTDNFLKDFINELCEKRKLSHTLENNMKILIDLSNEVLNNPCNELNTSKRFNSTTQINLYLKQIYQLCCDVIVKQSKDIINILKNKIPYNFALFNNILKQAIKLFCEYSRWFEIDNLFNDDVVDHFYLFSKIMTIVKVI